MGHESVSSHIRCRAAPAASVSPRKPPEGRARGALFCWALAVSALAPHDATMKTAFVLYDRFTSFGARPTGRRVVRQGKIITAAGVSSGIDMGLALVAEIYGENMGRAIQLAIEYHPQPPFDAGSPEKAGPELVAMVTSLFSGNT